MTIRFVREDGLVVGLQVDSIICSVAEALCWASAGVMKAARLCKSRTSSIGFMMG